MKLLYTLRNWRNEIILLGLTLLVVLISVYIARLNLEIRLKELDVLLEQDEYVEERISHMNLIMKYINHRQLYENKITIDKLNLSEFKLNNNLNNEGKNVLETKKFSFLERQGIRVINIFRFFTGKSPIRIEQDVKQDYPFHLAYIYERNREYQKALDLYNSMSIDSADTLIAQNISLHKGFCHALLGNETEARKEYNGIIKNHPNTSASVTATVLLKYLEHFKDERERILSSDLKEQEKGQKLAVILHFREAIRILENINLGNARDLSELNYYKGLCYEELGNKEKAVDSYFNTIRKDLKSPFSRYANRRIFIIGTQMENGDDVRENAVNMGQHMNDTVLSKISELYDKEVSRKSRDELSKTAGIDPALLLDTYNELNIALLDKLIGKKVRIYTKRNENFSGILVSNKNVNIVRVRTILGEVGIDKEKIEKVKLYQ